MTQHGGQSANVALQTRQHGRVGGRADEGARDSMTMQSSNHKTTRGALPFRLTVGVGDTPEYVLKEMSRIARVSVVAAHSLTG